MHFKNLLLAAAAVAAISAIAPAAFAQEEATDESARTLDTVVTIGTRVANRTALDTAAPVDVISSESLGKLGVGELNQALSAKPALVQLPPPCPQ